VLPKLGILAGRGPVPGQIVRACQSAGREIFVIAFNGETDPLTVDSGVNHEWVDLSKVGRTIRLLKQAGVIELVMIGAVGRPEFSTLKPDWHGARLLPSVIKAARIGDDAIMKVLVKDLEKQGFKIVGAEEVLSNLAAPLGVLGVHEPNIGDWNDIGRGMNVVAQMGILDIGQAAVVRDGYVLAVEAAEGTDAMLRRCQAFLRDSPSGVLIKRPKPGQERRADLPTIGVSTVESVVCVGLNGIAVAAGGTLIVDRAAVIAAADAAGIFVCGVSEEDEVENLLEEKT